MLNLMFASFNSNTIGVTWGARTANPSGSPQVFSGVHVARSLVFCPFVLFLLAIVLSVLLWFTDSDYLFGILAIVWSVLWFTDSDYPFGILAIVLSVLLWFTDSDYPFGILAIVLSVLLWFTDFDYLFGILAIVWSVLWFTDSDIFKLFLTLVTYVYITSCRRFGFSILRVSLNASTSTNGAKLVCSVHMFSAFTACWRNCG